MGRGIIHRKTQTNRARDMGAPDHQRAGVGSLALASIHRDDPARVAEMMTPPPQNTPDMYVTVPRSAFDELVSRVQALEAAASGSAPQSGG